MDFPSRKNEFVYGVIGGTSTKSFQSSNIDVVFHSFVIISDRYAIIVPIIDETVGNSYLGDSVRCSLKRGKVTRCERTNSESS